MLATDKPILVCVYEHRVCECAYLYMCVYMCMSVSLLCAYMGECILESM